MIGRRSLLSLALGAAGASAAGIRPKDALRFGGALPVSTPADFSMSVEKETYSPSLLEMFLNRERSLLEESISRKMSAFHVNIPPHIASKRSWSQSFKVSEAQKEFDELRQLQQSMWNNDWFEAMLRKAGKL